MWSSRIGFCLKWFRIFKASSFYTKIFIHLWPSLRTSVSWRFHPTSSSESLRFDDNSADGVSSRLAPTATRQTSYAGMAQWRAGWWGESSPRYLELTASLGDIAARRDEFARLCFLEIDSYILYWISWRVETIAAIPLVRGDGPRWKYKIYMYSYLWIILIIISQKY